MNSLIKICGLTRAADLDAALSGGADLVGLVVHPASPRHVSLDQAAALAARARGRCVAVCVDPDDDIIDALTARVKPDMLQLHGRESPQRVGAIAARTKLALIKAVGLKTPQDRETLRAYAPHCAYTLVEGAAHDGAPSGGSGQTFNWSLLADVPRDTLILSGGLNAANVTAAIQQTHARAVDVSSGVESAPGVKDESKMKAFIAAARAAFDS